LAAGIVTAVSRPSPALQRLLRLLSPPPRISAAALGVVCL